MRAVCRVLAYLGQPVPLDDLLYNADGSLVTQAYAPKMLRMVNLAGFGMAAWDPTSRRPSEPFLYRTTEVPVFDQNLRQLAGKLQPSCLLAHVRGVSHKGSAVVGPQNLHPFRFPGFRVALAHNGDLAGFDQMKWDLLEHIKPEIARMVRGTTDSEWIYALAMSQLRDPTADAGAGELAEAVRATLRLLRQARERRGIATSSSVNLFLCDGDDLVATRFTFDFGCYGDKVHEANFEFISLWYTLGRSWGHHDGEWKMTGAAGDAVSAIVASEPLTTDPSTWIEVPEYSLLSIDRDGERIRVRTFDLDV
jgi:glutamine amidotransferase